MTKLELVSELKNDTLCIKIISPLASGYQDYIPLKQILSYSSSNCKVLAISHLNLRCANRGQL